MPRNASGTYSLPSGNPVSAGTLIDATWANNTLNDLANEMTDSLSRSGEGGMLAPFRLADGLQSTPGIAWSNEPSTGFYRAGTNEMWAVVGGTQITQFTSTGMAGRFAAGAVTTPSVTVQGDTNTGIFFPAADTIAFAEGGVEALRIDSSANVGIGTSSPATKLEVNGRIQARSSSDVNLAFVLNNTASGGREWQLIGSATGGLDGGGTFNLRDNTAGANRLTIDASGNVGLGVLPSAWFANSRVIQMGSGGCVAGRSTDATISELGANQFINASGNRRYISTNVASLYEQNAGEHRFFTAPSGTAGNAISFTQAITMTNGGNLCVGTASSAGARLTVAGALGGSVGNGGSAIRLNNTDTGNYASISAGIVGVSNNGMDFSCDGVRRMIITGTGNFCVRMDAVIPGNAASINATHDGGNLYGITLKNDSVNTSLALNFVNSSNTQIGSISVTTTATAFNTSSDRRLKENIVPADDAGSVIDSIEIVQHDWKVGGHVRYGVIAQDLNQVAPEAVQKGDDSEDIEKPWGVDYSKLVPMLVKEIQSLRARVAQLEAN